MTAIPPDLDRVFEAFSNGHRREIIYLLGLQPPTRFTIWPSCKVCSLPAIHKHIKLLESAGMVERRKIGRSKLLTLNRASLLGLQDWLGQYHAYWGTEQETLENYEAFLRRQEGTRKDNA